MFSWRTEMLDKLLELGGFTKREIEEVRPRAERTYEILGIDQRDMEGAIERLHRYNDLRIDAVRKLIGCNMITLFDLVLAKEEGKRKIIYADWPIPVVPLNAVSISAPDVYLGSPGQVLNLNLGQIFGKLGPITEAGEELGQAAGQCHCPLYQTHVGAIAKGIIPIPDLEVATGYMCEPPGAATQLLQELYGIPTMYIDGCIDGDWGEWPRLHKRQIEYFGGEMKRFLGQVEGFTGSRVTSDAQHQAIVDCAKLIYGLQEMLEMIARADRQPISQVDATIALWMINSPLTKNVILRTIDAVQSLKEEVARKIKKGEGILPKGAPRIFTSIAVAVDQAIWKMMEECGLSIAVTFAGKQPSLTKYKNPYQDYCDKIACGLHRVGATASSWGAIELIKELQREVGFDGMIICYSTSCKVYSLSPLMVKQAIAKEFGVPVMVLEGEFYDTRNYSAEQMRTRVETFAHMLKERRISMTSES
jgi:hypothetical protein